ncbi:GlxA family transcriptional regulator [Chitinilyticum aquatile]|uniref:GlxA family transcriptional regulator n=1 Tax=Chitinilyticum aquatile TaxID=362520 RepID=UPI00040D66A6|nr:helix-turn-helix domain-containing protein [Chitinilyticum aquatile]
MVVLRGKEHSLYELPVHARSGNIAIIHADIANMPNVAILLPEQYIASGACSAADMLQLANRLCGRTLFAWRFFSRDGAPARSSSGILLPASGRYADALPADALLVAGIGYASLAKLERQLARETDLASVLQAADRQGRLLGSYCTGTTFLAQAGVLAGRQATISWWLAKWFRERYPAVQLQPHAMLCQAGHVLTAGATTSCLELMLQLIREKGGEDLALECARILLLDARRDSQAPYAGLQQFSGHDDPLVCRAQHWLQQQLAQPFSLDQLASATHSSGRTLIRRFRSVLGVTPLQYLQKLRLHHACRQLQHGDTAIEQIVTECGYEDLSAFRRLFKREMSCTPAEYRSRFARAA